ncbi:MAG: lipopolysaccharide export system permease protein [Verrucomicrobiales bacterium]|jgi:lipopolysaccharide export system permease protein
MALLNRILRFLKAPENRGANILRLFGLIVALILFAIALQTVGDYNDGQRQLTEAKVDDELESLGRVTPFWLMVSQGAAATVAMFGLVIALAMGRLPIGQILSVAMISIGVTLSWSSADLFRNLDSLTISQMGELPSPGAYFGQQLLTCVLFLSVPVLVWAYHRAPLMDKYTLNAVLMPVALIFVALIAIWMIMDLTDNGRDFISAGAGFGMLGRYYLVQMPQMILLVFPITLLLALLYALGQMSKSNEIVSMLCSGQSMARILRPLLILGAYATLLCTVLKYEWAPNADARKQGILNQVSDMASDRKSKGKKAKQAEEWANLGWLYRNSTGNRTWFVGRVPVDLKNKPMRYVAVFWQHGTGKIFRTYRAEEARWDHTRRVWIFRKCMIYEFDEFGTATRSYLYIHEVPDWNETPWHVVGSSTKAEHLGIAGLTVYLRTFEESLDADIPLDTEEARRIRDAELAAASDEENPALTKKLAPFRTHWHYRWAEPFRCFFIVLMAAPLGIVHSRRGVLTGVAAAIGILSALIFLDGVFLALGGSGRAPAWIGAWGPNLILGVVGSVIFWMKQRNKEVPKFRFPKLFAKS